MTGELSAAARSVAERRTSAPFDLVGIDHAVLLVDDMAAALDFYHDALGCVPAFSYPEIAMEQLWCGSALIVLIDVSDERGAKARPAVQGGRNMDHLALAMGPFDPEALKAHLAARGVTIDQEAFHGGARGMGVAIYIRDPAGNRLELKGPPVY
jgi:catechol 2,3-dioxygenase-like lactoylglutathione lyase family enzyme